MLISSRITIFILLLAISMWGASGDPVRSREGMVVSASKIASDVGAEILRKGGNAIDAAVATGFALAVTHPTAGNLGGGGFMVIHLENGKNTTIDFREKAPASTHKNIYLDEDGNYDPALSTKGYTSSGVPGSVDGLLYALQKYGTMSPEEVIQPAINLAKNGFPIEYRFAESLNSNLDVFNKYPSTAAIFTNNGKKFNEGDTLYQTDLATTLEMIKLNGREGFYEGKIAEMIAEQSLSGGGYITIEDLKEYKSVERVPIHGFYKGYEIISMGPPSSGGIAVVQTLNVLERFNFSQDDWNSSEYIHTLVEILKRVYADRAEHLGDIDFYPVPIDWLTSKIYSDEIFSKIGESATPSSEIKAGIPIPEESEETTHFSVMDKFGNAVSTTVTLNSSYGNKIVVEGAGFLLNNEMDDFSAKPGTPNQFGLIGSEANAIAPGKRMLSSMTPTILLKDNKPFMVIGSPGGSTIITVVLQCILNVVDFNMNISEAVSASKIHHQWLPDEIYYEEYGLSLDVINNLRERGHLINSKRVLGRAEGILFIDGIFTGATDPRGYGKASGI